MSAASIKPYFVTRMKALSYSEHLNPRFDNVPENKLNKAFHVEIGDLSARKQDQQTLEVSCPVTVRAYFKNSNSESARDKAMTAIDEIITEVMTPANRLGSNIKNVSFVSARRESYSETNDSDVVAVLGFSALVIYAT